MASRTGDVMSTLAEDVCEKVVRIGRANTIGNEPQILALFLSAATSLSDNPEDYTPTGIVGELASGKTRLVKIVIGESVMKGSKKKPKHKGLFPNEIIYRVTSGSKKFTIYSPELREQNDIRIIEASEYQKLTSEQIEYFKAQSGDDQDFVYEFVDMAKQSTVRIEQPKRWFVFTYAQVEMDGELKSRMIVFSVENNRLINRAVNSMNHGRKYAQYKGRTYTLEGDPETEEEVRLIIEGVLDECRNIKIINPFIGAFDDLEDCARASSKRTSKMIESLFQSSARVNYLNRYRDKNNNILMAAQDIVNVLAFADILQSMILEIDDVDLAIIRYLSRMKLAMTATDIINAVGESGLAELKGQELLRRIRKLEDDNYVISTTGEDKRMKWYINHRKYIHPITVYWDYIYKVDNRPVVEPITGDKFNNILEYGKWFDSTYRSGIAHHDNLSLLTEEDSKESKLRLEIERILASGATYNTPAEIVAEVRRRTGATTLAAFGTDNTVQKVIDAMIEDCSIDYNKQAKRWVNVDPTVRVAIYHAKRDKNKGM